jgi:hypothetical protein
VHHAKGQTLDLDEIVDLASATERTPDDRTPDDRPRDPRGHRG